jgi:hypothetical protein
MAERLGGLSVQVHIRWTKQVETRIQKILRQYRRQQPDIAWSRATVIRMALRVGLGRIATRESIEPVPGDLTEKTSFFMSQALRRHMGSVRAKLQRAGVSVPRTPALLRAAVWEGLRELLGEVEPIASQVEPITPEADQVEDE